MKGSIVKMENDKFQEFIGEQFSKLFKEFQGLKSDVSGLKSDVSGLKSDVSGLKNDMTERFDRVDEQIAKLGALDHSDIEQVARQVEQLVVGQESFRTETRNTLEKMQYDINYLVRKTSTHDDDIIQLKKAK